MTKSTKQILGAFAYRDLGNGCLTCKYCYAGSQQGPFTEMSKIIGRSDKQGFVGDYFTVWIQEDNVSKSATLRIRKSPQNENQYDLEWTVEGSAEPGYLGTAMDYEGLLVGTYWSIE